MRPRDALAVCVSVLMLCGTALYVTHRLAAPRPKEQAGESPTSPKPSAPVAPEAAEWPDDLAWGVGTASTMTKVFCDEPFDGPPARQATISLSRNEIEGTQLVVVSRNEQLREVTVTVSELKGDAGVLSPSAVTWHRVGYVETKGERPYWVDKVGAWPDPLLPAGPFDVDKDCVQPLWLNVTTAPDTAAGVYRGAVTVAPAGCEPWAVALTVRVWDFALPRTGHLKTLCWMEPRAILRFYGLESMADDGAVDLVKRFAALSLRNRLGPGGTIGCGFSWAKPQWPARSDGEGYDFSAAEDMLQFGFERGMNCFLMAVIPNLKRAGWPDYSDPWKADFRTFVTAYQRFLQSKGWDKAAYVYNFDEAPRSHWPTVKDNYRMVKAIDPALRVMQCLNEPEGVRALAGFADTWDVYVQQYDGTGVAERQRAGDEVWWAVCIYPKERPNLFIDYPAIDARILGWLSWKYRVSGFEYWSTITWGKENVAGRDGRKWPDVPWQTAKFAGDGYLCYPGPGRQPLSSVRFENLRDGFEDYEYLWLLRDALPKLDPTERKKAEALLAVGAPLAESNAVYTEDPSVIAGRRAAIAAMLEKVGETR